MVLMMGALIWIHIPWFYILLFRWASEARPTSRPRGLPIPSAFRGAGGMGDNPPGGCIPQNVCIPLYIHIRRIYV